MGIQIFVGWNRSVWAKSTSKHSILNYRVCFNTSNINFEWNLFVGAHRALADVEAMIAAFSHSTFSHCLANLQPRSPTQQHKCWIKMKGAHCRVTSLVSSLGKPCITKAQAKRLDELGLTYSKLVKLHWEAKDEDSFKKALAAKKVKSKPLQTKLASLLKSRVWPSFISLRHVQLHHCSSIDTPLLAVFKGAAAALIKYLGSASQPTILELPVALWAAIRFLLNRLFSEPPHCKRFHPWNLASCKGAGHEVVKLAS